jgi:hypothetical protein
VNAESEEPVEEEDFDFMDLLSGAYLAGLKSADIGAATVAPMQAIEQATISLTAGANPSVQTEQGIWLVRPEALVAAAPRVVPRACFERPEPDRPTPLTIEGDLVYGHAFLWDSCHTGFSDRCIMPPRSASDYAYFHAGAVDSAEGDEIPVGQITLDTTHASLGLGPNATRRHYDDTGVAVADVRITDGRFGGWLCGALRDVPADVRRTLKASRISGDWRRIRGSLELVGLLGVNVAGYPIPRTEARLVATGGDDVFALIAAGVFTTEDERDLLLAEIIDEDELPDELLALTASIDQLRDYSAEERRKMAKDGRALPDGSFPIDNCADAEDAIRAQGRASYGKRARVRTHIRKRVRALGCTGDIFDDYK